MSWFNSSYRFRAPISVDFSSLSGAGTNDASVAVPASWDHFWDAIQSDGDDIRITDSDGITPLTYEWSGFDYANKAGTINIDDVPYDNASSQKLVWLYYGYDAATDGSGSVTPSSAKTGVLWLTGPKAPIVEVVAERPGSQLPLTSIQITKTEKKRVYFDLDQVLPRRCTKSAGNTYGDEISEVTANVVDTDDNALAADPISDSTIRYVSCRKGRGSMVSVVVDGTTANISDGSGYAINMTVYTADGEQLNPRAALYCDDLRPRA